LNSFAHGWRVDLQLSPSRFLLSLIPVLHLLAALAILHADLPLLFQGVLLILIALFCFFSWRQESRRSLILREQATADWWLECGTCTGRAELYYSHVWRYLVVMNFRGHDDKGIWRQRVVVFADAVSPDTFRRLRVRLRHGALPARNR
jgi:transposase